MNITEVAFSSYAVADVARARAFYEKTLGLKPTSTFEDGGTAFIEYQIGPHYFVIGKGAEALKPGSAGGVVTFEVESFDEAIAALRRDGAKFVMGPIDTGACHMALVSDPDGNTVMIHKRKSA